MFDTSVLIGSINAPTLAEEFGMGMRILNGEDNHGAE
jgi:hypothetical protein